MEVEVRNRLVRIFYLVFALGILFFIAAGVFAYKYVDRLLATLPDPARLATYQPLVPTIVYARNGEKIGEIFKERRYPKAYNEINPLLIKAFLAAEDARFFEHSGVDYWGSVRAVLRYIGTAAEVKQGGSTITQQLAKNVLLTRERTIDRKIKDMFLAIRIEKAFKKEKILELYLNTIFLGNNSYGVEAASQNYFRKSNMDLNLAEAALIAGLAPAPSVYAPTEDIKKARTRQKFVLERMLANKWITEDQYQTAFNKTQLRYYRAQAPNTQATPYFFMEVRKQLEEILGTEALASAGYEVHTTVDLEIQKKAQEIVQDNMRAQQDKIGFKGPIKRHGGSFTDALRKLLSDPLENDDDMERAIVVDIFPNLDAVAVIGQSGVGVLVAEDHRWALKTAKKESEQPIDFADILQVGDEINVKLLKRKPPARFNAKNTQGLLTETFKKYLDYFPGETNVNELHFYTLTDTVGVEASVMVMDGKTGEVLVMVGGTNFGVSQFNRATQALRQVGSGVKPFYYSLAMDYGFSPASQLSTEPIVIGDWKPENYDKKSSLGQTTLRKSLMFSYNIPSIHLFQAVGPNKIFNHFKNLGLNWQNRDLSLSLGSGSATLFQMVRAYTPFVNQGKLTNAVYIKRIVDKSGKDILKEGDKRLLVSPVAEPKVKKDPSDPKSPLVAKPQLLSPEAAFVSVRLLQDVVRGGTGTAANGVHPEAGGKTGTTNGYTDAWFIGVLPNTVGGVWVGFDDARKSLGNDGVGGKLSAPIWREVMRMVAAKYKPGAFAQPGGISYVSMNPETGKISFDGMGIKVPVVAGSEPGAATAKNAVNYGTEEADAEGAEGGVAKESTPAPGPSADDTDALRGL